MPIDYRAEIGRPLSLALGAAGLLGWLLVIATWLSYSSRLHEIQPEVTRLQQAEGEARGQLDQQRRTAGALADLQTRVTGAQRELAQLSEAREQVQAQLPVIQQTLQTTQQQLTELRNQLPQAEQRLATVKDEIARGEQTLADQGQQLAAVGRQLCCVRPSKIVAVSCSVRDRPRKPENVLLIERLLVHARTALLHPENRRQIAG